MSVDARRFASCRPLVVGSETTRFFHLKNCLFIVSVDARRFASCRPLVVGSETTRFFHLTKLFIYCECGCETFRFLSPIGCRKRNNSLLSPEKCLFIVVIEARCFASIAISSGSGTSRFHDHNNGTHESLQKLHYVRRNSFAYYANR